MLKLDTEQKIEIDVPLELQNSVGLPTAWTKMLCAYDLHLSEKEKKGMVLDLGTGSGILAISLSKRGCENVDACDVNPLAVKVTSENIRLNRALEKINVFKSNMYSTIHSNKYDLIVCNPPALPCSRKNLKGTGIDLFYFSGKGGRQFIDEAIKGAADVLLLNGRLIILHPSFHDIGVTRKTITDSGLQLKEDYKKKMFKFESLAIHLQQYGYNVQEVVRHVWELHKGSETKIMIEPHENGSFNYYLQVLEIFK